MTWIHATTIVFGRLCLWCMILTCVIALGADQMNLAKNIKTKRIEFDKIRYPYKADFNRSERIKWKSSKVQINMTQDEVIKLLDQPDLISFVYDTTKKGRTTGFFYFYLLQQDAKHGSQKEMNQQSITVYFDLNGTVCRVIGKNTPFFDDIIIAAPIQPPNAAP